MTELLKIELIVGCVTLVERKMSLYHTLTNATTEDRMVNVTDQQVSSNKLILTTQE